MNMLQKQPPLVSTKPLLNLKPLEWSEQHKPNDNVRYNHCIAHTPFGRFLITWKGWKDNVSPEAEETPWGEYYDPCADSVEEAQANCEREFARRLALCLVGVC